MGISLDTLLAAVPKEVEGKVLSIRQRIRPLIEGILQTETGLLLNRNDEAQPQPATRKQAVSVPVRVKPGLPAQLRGFELDDDHWLLTLLSRYRTRLEAFRDAATTVTDLFAELGDRPQGRDLLRDRDRSIAEAMSLASELLKMLEDADPVSRVLAVNDDVLGLYAYELPREPPGVSFAPDPLSGSIELYWGVIGLCADWLGVDVSALAAVVLAHELAHAYTHLGSDIDRRRWRSKAFAQSEHALKEGLAQYYTDVVCRCLERAVPEAHSAYRLLLHRQPRAYHTHLAWTTYTPEEVRLALIEVRRSGAGTTDDFYAALAAARAKLRAADRNE